MKRRKILLIDTNEDYRNNIAELLDQEGLTVLHACDAYTGLKQINLYQPHAVICDTALGNASALELIKMLKETGKASITNTAFIFLYSEIDDTTRAQAQAHGVSHFIDKLSPWPAIQKAVWSVLTPCIH